MNADYHSVFALEDLLANPRDIAEAILSSCHRRPFKRPIALCQLEGRFVVILQPHDQPPQDMQFETMTNPDLATLQAILHERWQGGYEPVGLVSDRNEAGEVQAFLLLHK